MKKQPSHPKPTMNINNVFNQTLAQIEQAAERPDGISGIPSGFNVLDKITSGFQKSELIIIGSRPSMGKTAFLLSMIRNMAVDHKTPIALFSLESKNIKIAERLMASECELGSEKFRSGKLNKEEWEELNTKCQDLVNAPIFIDDTPYMTTSLLREKCIKLQKYNNVNCFCIDFIQLMKADSEMKGNLEQETNIISRELKRITQELNVTFIVLSQLNRDIERRTEYIKKPKLTDLRDSGALEEDSDMVLFIHRPEKYGILSDSEGNDLRGVADIIIAKHRNGAVGDIQLQFKNEFSKFCDLEEISPFSPIDSGNVPQKFQSKMDSNNSKMQIPFGQELPTAADFDEDPPF